MNKKGGALYIVLAVVLCLSLLFSALLNLQGNLRRQVELSRKKICDLYRAESSLLVYLEGYPSDYFGPLPQVNSQMLGPWERIQVEVPMMHQNLQVMLGKKYESLPFSQGVKLGESIQRKLKADILQNPALHGAYGNHRYFNLQDTMVAKHIHHGDLTVEHNGVSTSLNFYVEGTTTITLSKPLDTLRLYGLGPVVIRGREPVGWLEVFGVNEVSIGENVKFRGVVVAGEHAEIRDRNVLYPSLVLSGGRLAMDSSLVLLPSFIEGKNVVWQKRMVATGFH